MPLASGWQVFKDEEPVSPVYEFEDACYIWLQKHQPMSWDWAIKHEGYSVRRVGEGEETSKR